MDKAKLKHIPDAPGVYIFKDRRGNILYIGKARSLSKRVRNYFYRPQSPKIQAMVSKVSDFDYIITKSEPLAMIQEAKLIKQNLPPYNTALRDDKTFPMICISDEKFPVVWVARRTSKRLKYSDYRIGPYTDAGSLRRALKSIRHIFGFRSCFKMPKKACLYYRLGLCPAPCIGKISVRKYHGIIKDIILLLEGDREDLINRLTAKMNKLAANKEFEEAALVRNQIQVLNSISPEQLFANEGLPYLSESYRESMELKHALGLNVRPQRIEAFDVSNISGSSACASMVSFYEGRPDKKNYRRFRIKAVQGIDDYKMLQEAVGRRYLRLREEKMIMPELIIIDGGRGQLNVIEARLKELGLRPAVISIAKKREEVFIADRRLPIRLKEDSAALRLIKRIRDEAHRFALSYHHVLRRKKTLGE